ncbi:MAG: hypothetical protein JWQ38_1990 [Flavipsychrobacter sp.]|nr:hypothetical protein [Flavipsychrobacter sp.]
MEIPCSWYKIYVGIRILQRRDFCDLILPDYSLISISYAQRLHFDR